MCDIYRNKQLEIFYNTNLLTYLYACPPTRSREIHVNSTINRNKIGTVRTKQFAKRFIRYGPAQTAINNTLLVCIKARILNYSLKFIHSEQLLINMYDSIFHVIISYICN